MVPLLVVKVRWTRHCWFWTICWWLYCKPSILLQRQMDNDQMQVLTSRIDQAFLVENYLLVVVRSKVTNTNSYIPWNIFWIPRHLASGIMHCYFETIGWWFQVSNISWITGWLGSDASSKSHIWPIGIIGCRPSLHLWWWVTRTFCSYHSGNW